MQPQPGQVMKQVQPRLGEPSPEKLLTHIEGESNQPIIG